MMTNKDSIRSEALSLLTAYVGLRWVLWGLMLMVVYQKRPETAKEVASILGLAFTEVYALLALGYLAGKGPAWGPTRVALGTALAAGFLLSPVWFELRNAFPVEALVLWGLYLAFKAAR